MFRHMRNHASVWACTPNDGGAGGLVSMSADRLRGREKAGRQALGQGSRGRTRRWQGVRKDRVLVGVLWVTCKEWLCWGCGAQDFGNAGATTCGGWGDVRVIMAAGAYASPL